MIATVGLWDIVLTLCLVFPIGLLASFIAYLIHRDSQNEVVNMSVPRIVPWSIAARARRVRAEAELEEAKSDLYKARHARLQQELVYPDLEDARLKKALGEGGADG